MKVFDVHAPDLQVRKSLFLEASAGTGKTYSIENIVARALLEESEPALNLEQILIVTFTKAAAKDLRARIRLNLLAHNKNSRIREALLQFDHAAISTIHAFCYNALSEFGKEAGVRLRANPEKLSQDLVWEVMERFFRQGLHMSLLSPLQLNILLKRHMGRVTELARDLIRTISRGMRINTARTNEKGLEDFKHWLKQCKVDGWSRDKVFEELVRNAPHFYGICDKAKKIKPEFINQFEYLASLFEREEIVFADLEPLFTQELTYLADDNLKKSSSQSSFLEKMQKNVLPILEELGTYAFLFARIAQVAQEELWKAFSDEESADFSYLLIIMEQLVSRSEEFRNFIRKRYRMVIIDEFQDTDPIQWNIFKTLFFHSEIALILVGDPKQSIYSFRSADIYTYLEAADCLGPESKYILNTNYRSSPQLVAALNHLFRIDGWMRLPLLKKELVYLPVQAPIDKKNKWTQPEAPLSIYTVDAAGGMKLDEIEEKFLFPRFLSDVERIHLQHKTPYREIAFLVRDHAQSGRLLNYLRKNGLPATQMRSSTLDQALVLPDLILLLKGFLQPRQLSTLQAALGSSFFQWNCLKLEELKTPSVLADVVFQFLCWHTEWVQEGIGRALQNFLSTHFLASEESLQEQLISTQEGLESYHELMQITEWLIEREHSLKLTPAGLIKELESFQGIEQESLKMRPFVSQDAVSILTLHMSKGLEFDVVFALGVINRTPIDEELILSRDKHKISLIPKLKNSTGYFEEKDAEKSRQLYVALTRAREKLILPVVLGWKEASAGAASPIELLLACYAKDTHEENLKALCQGNENIALEELSACGSKSINHSQQVIQIQPPESFRPHFLSRVCVSFTGLAKRQTEEIQLQGVPHDFESTAYSPHQLPAGNVTGELMHKMLEELPWQEIALAGSAKDLLVFVQRFTSSSPYAAWEQVLAEMLFNAFKKPLGATGIQLDQLNDSCSYREMEFIYPVSIARHIPECAEVNGVVKGVVDLFFVWREKYYLLDWKTNWLGPTIESYAFENLALTIKNQRYDLQAALYRNAIKQYLKKIDSRPFEKIFGGIFYLFLRGFDGEKGLFFIPEKACPL